MKIEINKWFVYTSAEEEPYILDFTNEKVDEKDYDRFCREVSYCIEEQIYKEDDWKWQKKNLI